LRAVPSTTAAPVERSFEPRIQKFLPAGPVCPTLAVASSIFIDAKSIAVWCLCDAAGADPDYCPHPAEQSRALVRLLSAHYFADAESPR
jgi:hypothetical protein